MTLLLDTNPLPVRAVPYVGLRQTVGQFPNAAIISINGPEDGYTPSLPSHLPVLKLAFSDIHCGSLWTASQVRQSQDRGLVLATADHVAQAIAFSRKHRDRPLVVHCTAGISRSPAIALILTVDRFGLTAIDKAGSAFLAHHPHILPNPYLLSLGTTLLASPKALSTLLPTKPDPSNDASGALIW